MPTRFKRSCLLFMRTMMERMRKQQTGEIQAIDAALNKQKLRVGVYLSLKSDVEPRSRMETSYHPYPPTRRAASSSRPLHTAGAATSLRVHAQTPGYQHEQ